MALLGYSPGLPTIADGTHVTITMACDASAAVGDVVRQSSSADSTAVVLTSNSYDGLAIGIITAKPTTTSCQVRLIGLVTGFSGLTRGYPVFVHTDGTPTSTPPISGGLQILGTALSADSILLNIGANKVTRT